MYAIKVDCGNPLGNLSWNPPPPNAKPTGSITITCDPKTGSASIGYKFSDKDVSGGNTNAVTAQGPTANDATPVYSPSTFDATPWWTRYTNTTSASGSVAAADTYASGTPYYVNMYVQDLGPSGTKKWYLVGAKRVTCDHPPVGAVTGNCADGIQIKNAYDGDSPATNLRIDVYANAAHDKGGLWQYSGRAAGRTLTIPLSALKGVTDSSLGLDQKPIQFFVYLINVNSSGAEAGTAAHGQAVLTIGPCGSCQSIPVTAASGGNSPQPGESFKSDYKVYYPDAASAASAASSPITLRVSGPSGNQAVQGVNNVAGSSGSGASLRYFVTGTANFAGMSPTGQNVIALTAGGAFPVQIVSSLSPNPCVMNISVKPYLSVGMGDVYAGAPVVTSTGACSTQNTSAGIAGWNSNQPGYSGAGGKFGVTALAAIMGFASAQGSGQSGVGTSFANTAGAAPSRDEYGGQFGNGGDCWQPPTTNVTTAAGGTVNGMNVSTAEHKVLHFTGDIYISGNMIYAGSWAALRDIPSLVIYVDGNIFIGKDVTRLDGTYVARKTATAGSGSIYTCATSAARIDVSSPSYYTDCGKQLVVNGSLIADRIYFLRTCGSLNKAQSPEPVTSSGGADLLTCGAGSHAAEVINNGPADWAGRANANGLVSDQWDSVVSLPPVL